MDPKVGPDQHTPSDQRTPLERQPASDQFLQIDSDQITPAGNAEFLHQHQRQLRSEYPSSDLSDGSSHTEHAGFPGSRHSSLNTEPLTLDVVQIHDAKDKAVDVIQHTDADTALNIFTKGFETSSDESVSEEAQAKAIADQINSLVEKAQQVVEANEQQSRSKLSGPASSSLDEKKSAEGAAPSLDDDGKLKAD